MVKVSKTTVTSERGPKMLNDFSVFLLPFKGQEDAGNVWFSIWPRTKKTQKSVSWNIYHRIPYCFTGKLPGKLLHFPFLSFFRFYRMSTRLNHQRIWNLRFITNQKIKMLHLQRCCRCNRCSSMKKPLRLPLQLACGGGHQRQAHQVHFVAVSWLFWHLYSFSYAFWHIENIYIWMENWEISNLFDKLSWNPTICHRNLVSGVERLFCILMMDPKESLTNRAFLWWL